MNINCSSGKNGYSKSQAVGVRNGIYKERPAKLRIYFCPECFMWHLTSVLEKSFKRRKKNYY